MLCLVLTVSFALMGDLHSVKSKLVSVSLTAQHMAIHETIHFEFHACFNILSFSSDTLLHLIFSNTPRSALQVRCQPSDPLKCTFDPFHVCFPRNLGEMIQHKWIWIIVFPSGTAVAWSQALLPAKLTSSIVATLYTCACVSRVATHHQHQR